MWFPDPAAAGPDLVQPLASAAALEKQFIGAVRENLAKAAGRPFPQVHRAWLHRCLPWEPRTRRVDDPVDLTADLVEALKAESGAPAGLPWPPAWEKALGEACGMVVVAVHAMAARADVVVAFTPALHVDKGRPPTIAAPGTATVETVRRIYERWADRTKRARPVHVFFTVGSPVRWPDDVQGLAAGAYDVTCFSPGAGGRWEARKPSRYSERVSLTDFRDRLEPETEDDRCSTVKTLVDGLLAAGGAEAVHLERVKAELARAGIEYRRSAIVRAFEHMRTRSQYRLYRTPEGILAVDRGSGRSLAAGPSDARRLFWRHAAMLVGFIVPTVVGQVAGMIRGESTFQWSALGVSVVGGYLAAILTKPLARRREESV